MSLMDDVRNYVETNIPVFHQKRIENLRQLSLIKILKRKNPYLFKAKNILTSHDLVKSLLDAHLSSQEETIFGDWLEGLAIYINEKVYNGRKSGITGIDLEFDKENIRYIVSIKSGPHWGNSSQIKKMIQDFNQARKTLRTSNSKLNIIAVNGCCYGRDNNPEKDDNYSKYCGEAFWEFISGERNLYREIIEPLGHKAQDRNNEFHESYSQVLNNFTMEFSTTFCVDGIIDWDKLLILNSSKQ